MEDKIAKLQAATDEAEAQMKLSQEASEMAGELLTAGKAKYQSLNTEEQETLQVNDTELPELLETHVRAKHVYETVQARYATNKRYLDAFKAKMGS